MVRQAVHARGTPADSLSAAFFTPEVRREFGMFRTAAATQSAILRMRLSIDSNAAELHAIRWETLRDPDLPADRNSQLFTGEQTVVSRFLSSGGDWRPIRLHPKGKLRALAVIANPGTSIRIGSRASRNAEARRRLPHCWSRRSATDALTPTIPTVC